MTDRLTGDNLRRYQDLKKSETHAGYLAKYHAYNSMFATQPMEFFRRYAVLPPSKAGGQTMTSQGSVWTDVSDEDTRAVTGGSHGSTAEVLWKSVPLSQRVVRINFEKKTTGNEKEALTFTVGTTGVPIYFLPWESLSIVSLAIPDAKGAFYEPDDPDMPGLFFTAAINGCSVFVKGDPFRPEVFHAGIDGDFASTTSAVEFWQDRMRTILAKQGPGGGHLGATREINKRDYIKDPTFKDPTTTATASAFEDWLKHNQSDEFRVQAVSPWACVFGIRFGRAWSFYLQENATATIMRYVKKSSTEMVALNASRTQRQMKGTGAAVTAESQKVKTGPFSTTKTIYMTRQEVSRPLQIREFFPNGGGLIRITDQVRRI